MTPTKRPARPQKPAAKADAYRYPPGAVGKLYRAVVEYIEKGGGKVVVIGGVEIQRWESDPNRFRLAVKILGKSPLREVKR